MSATDKQLTQDKAVVDAYYQAAVRGELTTFGQYVHPDFVTTAPNYLPWGGTHLGAAWFRETCWHTCKMTWTSAASPTRALRARTVMSLHASRSE
jgi:ketosteroid isomerase-like protein